MQIFNTLTKKKEDFVPINPPEVTMYVCGPTVYDFFHIGNGRTFIMSDIIRRYLEYKGYKVKYVMNLTDIDDKIIRKANEEHTDTKEISERYGNAFLEDISKLKIKKADVYPKATENINDIIKMISDLIDEGYAYNVSGNVFFNVNKFNGYGKLSGKKIDELEAGARIEINDEKTNPLDFSLWKKAKEGEPFWESPWGKGRPGWHIECSVMSLKYLGKTIDIHAGGSDLIFPHHENEIAQSEAVNKNQFVKYWVHFGFLNIQNEKMSKSLGNFFTARDILNKYSAEAIRLLFLQTHYAGPLNFSEELLSASEKGLEKIKNTIIKIKEIRESHKFGNEISELDFHYFKKQFEEAMDDDFNTPRALAVIFDFIKNINSEISQKEKLDEQFYIKADDYLTSTAVNVLALADLNNFKNESRNNLEDALIKTLIDLRIKAKNDKNYQLADEIRNRLKEIGIELMDSKTGSTYKIC
ncbi:MAG: cysteine--tRNA ligase [Ignavibacteria bacterium]|nr:cysteine--tRNA ligase [Ignavibacteria bacterium]